MTIRAHNTRSSSYKLGISAHTDKTEEEWTTYMKGYNREVAFATQGAAHTPPPVEQPAVALPDALDWREHKIVTDVKDQASCGSCWAFSATETMESAVAKATGRLVTLAPQEYVDCAPNPRQCGGTGGCEGSTQWLAFNFSVGHGLSLSADYNYTAREGTCRERSVASAVSIAGYERLQSNDYSSLLTALATHGPIAISVSATWRHYEEGVYDDKCGTTIDHAVQLVGYGTDEASGKMYWLVRNSWGTSWGESGYIRIRRYGEGAEPCGVDRSPQSGTACKGAAKTMKVCGLCGIMSDSSYPIGVNLTTRM